MSSGLVTSEDIPQVRDRLVKAMEEAREKKAIQTSFLTQNFSEIIDWPKFRPHMTLDILQQVPDSHLEPGPVISQEYPLIEDLLSCFLGVSGQLITPDPLIDHWAERTFSINNKVDTKLAELAKKSLEMASNYSLIVRFIQENRKLAVGRVNQALVVALENFVDSYTLFILELENRNRKAQLNLHTLWFLIQPVNHPLQVVAKLTKHIAVNRLRGADTLNYLLDYAITLMDMSKEKEVCIYLAECAAAPIMLSVQKWIFNGIIYDPFDEFMIVGNPRVQFSKERFPDEYWSKRYQIRKSCTPSFLKCVETTVLNAGKYLNVIKDCLDADWNVKLAVEEDVVYTYRGSAFVDVIGRAYTHSSKYLLSLMIDEYSIIERIKSVKRYLLLQQGDFVVQLLDNCEEELCQPIANCIPTRLSTLVEMAIRLPSTADDEFRDDIVMQLKSNHLAQQVLKILNTSSECDDSERQYSEHTLTGLQAFSLNVKCTWPVSLVFNVTVIAAYQMIFRHLFYCKYIERLLSKIRLMDRSVRNLHWSESKCYTIAFGLRHKMKHFIQSIEYYMMEEAIEPNWIEFLHAMRTVESIDSLLDVHWMFLTKCMKDCLLTTPTLYIVFQNLISTCEEFCNYIISLDYLEEIENHAEYTEATETIEKLDQHFQEQLVSFLNKITEESSSDLNNKLWNIILRENYNNYFDGVLSKLKPDKKADSIQSDFVSDNLVTC